MSSPVDRSPLQANAASPIEPMVATSLMFRLVSDPHPENASVSMPPMVIPEKLISARFVHPAKARSPIEETELFSKRTERRLEEYSQIYPGTLSAP